MAFREALSKPLAWFSGIHLYLHIYLFYLFYCVAFELRVIRGKDYTFFFTLLTH